MWRQNFAGFRLRDEVIAVSSELVSILVQGERRSGEERGALLALPGLAL